MADALAENAPEPAAEEAARDLLENPADADNQAAFRKELRKAADEDPVWRALLADLLSKTQAKNAQLLPYTCPATPYSTSIVSTVRDNLCVDTIEIASCEKRTNVL